MIESIVGSKNKENILIFIAGRNEGYARQIADYYNVSLSPVQNQLNNLETGGVLFSKNVGKTILYSFNPRYPFLNQLKELLEKVILFLPKDEKEKLLMARKRPRRKGKPL